MSGMYFLNDWEEDILSELRLSRRDRERGRFMDAEAHQENVRMSVAAVDENEAEIANAPRDLRGDSRVTVHADVGTESKGGVA